jgi:hypothetical protein
MKIEVYRITSINVPIVLNGCETWHPVLREKRRLREFWHRSLKKDFGPKADEMRGYWCKLHVRELRGFTHNISWW